MLRSILIALGVVLALCGAGLLLWGSAAGVGPLLFGALLLLGTVWERVQYKKVEQDRPGAGWIATDERFIDEKTGKPVRVWTQPATGERRYVAD